MITHDYTTGGEPYPDRAHIVGLTQAYRVGLAQMTRQWADWAEQLDTERLTPMSG
ncbi:hypothetical protein [Amycolatopsis sp. NPDC051128]|uniref:hypothetical protein n=1 Tax=Amycolatopsis sp. NPDC051128 TaxID=3155412 RepID=UPI003424D7FF